MGLVLGGSSGGGITASSTDTLTNKTIDGNSNTITNVGGGGGALIGAVTGSDYECSNNAVQTDVTGMTVALEASSVYRIDVYVQGDNDNSQTSLYKVTYTGTNTGASLLRVDEAGELNAQVEMFDVDIYYLAFGTRLHSRALTGYIRTGTAGNLKVQMRQQAASAVDSSFMKIGSNIMATKLT